MNIHLLIHHFPPDVNSTGLLMSQVYARLAAEGHEISVLTTFPHYEGFRTEERYRRKLFETDDQNGMTVRRVYSYTSGEKTMKRRLLNYLSFNLFAFLAGLFTTKCDVVFCTNGSFFSGLIGWALARLKRAKCIYNLQDLYPEVPVAQGQLTSRSAIKVLEWIERFMYRRADHLAVITPGFKKNLVSKGVPSSKISVIPNFVNIEFIRPLPKDNEFSRQHGLADKFVVSHAGNVGYVYDLETLLAAAQMLEGDSEIVFLIVGDGVARHSLEIRADSLGLKNVVFLPFQPVEQLPYLRAASDVQLSLYKARSSTYSMPSKVYEIMASGRPLLASADEGSDIHRLVEQSGCGVFIPPGNPAKLAEAVRRLKDDPEGRAAMGKEGREEAESNYSLERVTEQYLALLERIARSG